jgi:opacity protein-like surface antigen
MSTVMKSAPMLALMALLTLVPVAASAQDQQNQQDQRFRVSFAPSMATLGGDAELALGGSFGYRFSEHFWFEGDLTWFDAAAGGFRDREFDLDVRTASANLLETVRRRGGMFGRGGITFPALSTLSNFPIGVNRLFASTAGSTIVGTLGVRYELPVQTARFRPYVSGGLGINNTKQDLRIEPLTIDESFSRTGYAFSGGAGASVRLAGQLWGDMDAKYFRLSQERNIMRLGGGVTFRF